MKAIVNLPRSRYLPKNATKATLAALLYPGMDFDSWLPESWAAEMRMAERSTGLLLEARDFIWGFPKGLDRTDKEDKGVPLPLTEEARRLLDMMPPDLRLEGRAGGMETPWHGHPPAEEYVPNHMTKDQLTELVYPGIYYDTALPQEWVNAKTLEGWDPRPCVVWGYLSKADAPSKADATASALPAGLPGGIFGCPLPLTAEAKQRLEDGR